MITKFGYFLAVLTVSSTVASATTAPKHILPRDKPPKFIPAVDSKQSKSSSPPPSNNDFTGSLLGLPKRELPSTFRALGPRGDLEKLQDRAYPCGDGYLYCQESDKCCYVDEAKCVCSKSLSLD